MVGLRVSNHANPSLRLRVQRRVLVAYHGCYAQLCGQFGNFLANSESEYVSKFSDCTLSCWQVIEQEWKHSYMVTNAMHNKDYKPDTDTPSSSSPRVLDMPTIPSDYLSPFTALFKRFHGSAVKSYKYEARASFAQSWFGRPRIGRPSLSRQCDGCARRAFHGGVFNGGQFKIRR